MKKYFKSLNLITLLSLLPSTVLAADPDVEALYNYVGQIYWRFALPIGVILTGFMIMYGGILYATSSGDSAKVGKAKEFIVEAIIGLTLLITAALILRTIVG